MATDAADVLVPSIQLEDVRALAAEVMLDALHNARSCLSKHATDVVCCKATFMRWEGDRLQGYTAHHVMGHGLDL